MDVSVELQAAMDIIFGLKEPDGKGKRFKTLFDLYQYYTGDEDMVGLFNPRGLASDLRSNMSITASTFPNAMANTLNRFISGGYDQINYFEDVLISQKKPASHLHEGKFIQLGCWGILETVNPETGDYPDMPNITEQAEAFDIIQKGCVIPISRKTIVNDDVDLLKKLMERLGLVARKTHARYVWNLYINNEDSNDGTPWFSSDHGNLGSDTIGFSSVASAITTLAELIEPGPSNDKVGLDLSNFKWHLIVPVSKWADAVEVNQVRTYYTSNDLTTKTVNPCFHLFGANNERIATPPFLADPNEWGVARGIGEVPIIEMEYLPGTQKPEIYFEQDPRSDIAIKGDWFGLKCRHGYGGKVSDHRGAYKSAP